MMNLVVRTVVYQTDSPVRVRILSHSRPDASCPNAPHKKKAEIKEK
jgi:hypothetical protein